MNTETLAGALLQVFEGCHLMAYRDTGGVWTIGFGHTEGVEEGQVIAMAAAYDFLRVDAAPLFELVQQEPMLAAAAYVSFGYNCGRSTLELVLAGKAKLTDFVHDRHGARQAGLVARRNLEAALIASAAPATA